MTNKEHLVTLRSMAATAQVKRRASGVLCLYYFLNLMTQVAYPPRISSKKEISKSSSSMIIMKKSTAPDPENLLFYSLENGSLVVDYLNFQNRHVHLFPTSDEVLLGNDDGMEQVEENPISEEHVEEATEEMTLEEGVEEPVEPTNDEKIEMICERYGLTKEEFDVIKAVVVAEAKWFSYEDAYAVINTIFNRSISAIWIYDVERLQGEGTGRSMYHQVTQYHQFDPYWYSGTYKNYLEDRPETVPAVQAVIDFLYGVPVEQENGETILLPARLHDYANFVGYQIPHQYKSYAFVECGNNFGVPLKEEHYVSYDFTTITEAEVETRAQEVEEACRNYLNPEEQAAEGKAKVLEKENS